MKVSPYLKFLAEKDGPELYLSTGAKFSGIDRAPPGWIKGLANELMSDRQKPAIKDKPEMNLALSLTDAGRFRVKSSNSVTMFLYNW